MAKSDAVWGIDIGQCALKALRCRPHEKDDNRMVIEAFDYIEYPKILTQPEANKDELIREALQQFVSRNDVEDDSVAIAVPGQSGLARFIKLPPVERKKIPDIVKYEARQQIPFALEDVVWDYQPLVGSEDEGYAIETEVGLFAMKRDQVARALKPLDEAGISVDTIQLAPLAIYNFICFDRLKLEGAYDPANPPPSTVIISLGTDTTDLVITNGFRVWQRSIPIGGNHFTKALTKELKLTFAKAEHLKRNAMKAENPKAVFQAMRPVFSDLVAEIQRSIGFFTSNNRNAKLGDMVALGNPMKLPGLQRFLSQNLDQDVKLIDSFNNLVGGSATAGAQFKDNQLTFGVAYGLCVQALGQAQLRTNLLPEEIVTTRLVRAKKPWAVAAAAVLLLGVTINYFGHYSSVLSANVEDPQMDSALKGAQSAVQNASSLAATHTELTTKFDEITKIGHSLQSNVDGRLLWLELLKAIDAALPKDMRPPEKREESAEDVAQRPELHIESIDSEYFADLAPWYASIQRYYTPSTPEPAPPADAAASPEGAAEAAEADGAVPPEEETFVEEMPVDATADQLADAGGVDPVTGEPLGGTLGQNGPGWVIQLTGYHLHNSLPDGSVQVGEESNQFIINTFFRNLEHGTVELPDGPGGELVEVPIAELGVRYPVVVTQEKTKSVTYLADASEAATSGSPYSRGIETGRGIPGSNIPGEEQPKIWKLRQYDFIIQFAWQPQPRGQRLEKMAGQGESTPGTAAAVGDATRTGDSS
jgi:type IV pilus assembly protein PilM